MKMMVMMIMIKFSSSQGGDAGQQGNLTEGGNCFVSRWVQCTLLDHADHADHAYHADDGDD